MNGTTESPSTIVITVYATIFYVLTSKFGSLVPFSKMISQKLKINLLVVESIIFGLCFIFSLELATVF